MSFPTRLPPVLLLLRNMSKKSSFYHFPGKALEYFYKKRFYLFIFRERGREGKEGEKHQCVVASCAPPTGGWSRNPGMCPDWESNP